MRLELERDLELFFQKVWNKVSLIPFVCFLCCSLASDIKKNICNPLIYTFNDTKIAQFDQEMKIYIKKNW